MDCRARAYCVTINNYEDEDLLAIKDLKIVYAIIGKEVGKEGTKHLQVYLYFKNAVSFSSLKKKLLKAHIEAAKGTAKQNREYCSKEGSFEEIGTIPVQGKRSDIEEVKELLQDGANMRDIVSIAKSVQSIRMAEIQLKYFEKKRNWKPLVKWYWGPPGTGKSHQAFAELKDPYVCMSKSKWWEGYDGHEEIIIDDMRSSFALFEELLRILDKYPYTVECKGGSRQLLAKTIIITSTFSPYNTYATGENILQLVRRIDEIREFNVLYYDLKEIEDKVEKEALEKIAKLEEPPSSDEEDNI